MTTKLNTTLENLLRKSVGLPKRDAKCCGLPKPEEKASEKEEPKKSEGCCG